MDNIFHSRSPYNIRRCHCTQLACLIFQNKQHCHIKTSQLTARCPSSSEFRQNSCQNVALHLLYMIVFSGRHFKWIIIYLLRTPPKRIKYAFNLTKLQSWFNVSEIIVGTTKADESLSKFTFLINRVLILSLLNSVINFVAVINGFLPLHPSLWSLYRFFRQFQPIP